MKRLPENNKITLGEYIGYGVGPIGKNMMSSLVNGEYLPNFFRTELKINNGFLAIMLFVPNISYGAMSMMQSVMLSDAVDYGEWKYGERNEGIIFSMLTFLSKISNGISYLIRYSGFAAVKFDTQVGAMASLAAIKMIKFLLFAVPPMFLIAAFLLHKAKFKLVPAYMSQITDEIKLKRASLENSNGVLNNE